MKVVAIDSSGLQSEEIVRLERQMIPEAQGPAFAGLDPTKGRRVKKNGNASIEAFCLNSENIEQPNPHFKNANLTVSPLLYFCF